MDNTFAYIVLSKLNKFLFIIVLIELFLGGGGRLTEFGFLTLRMILFFTILAVNIPLFFLTNKIKKYIINLLIAFTLPLIFSFAVGFLNHADLHMIFEDVKPLSYFYSFIFFYINIRELSDIKYIIKVLKACSVIMAVIYIIVFCLVNFHLINYSAFYSKLSEYTEFAFRGDQAIFYKGFLFMCIGFFFFFNEKTFSSQCISAVIFTAIFLTFMRGFVLSLIVTYTIYMLFFTKINIKNLLTSAIILGGLFIILGFFQTQNIGNREESDSIRLTTINQVLERTNFIDIFIGHGFGNGVPIRTMHMEISYLEIFYKQGIIGLLFWLYVFSIIVRFYGYAVKNNKIEYAKPLLLGCIFVYIQSFTNPFVNNPIGMSMLVVSIICLNILNTLPKDEYDISLHTDL